MAGGFSPDRVQELLSPYRFPPYLERSDGDPARALQLYEWSANMSAAAFEIVAHLEVMMRNAIDTAMRDHYNEEFCGIPWFLCRPPMSDETHAAVDAVRARLRPLGRDTRHQIVAGLSFGFWSGMLGRRYEDLWRVALRHAFPGSSGARKQVATAVEAIRKFRNRLAHHDSMLNIDIPFEVRRVSQVAGFISPDGAAWLRQVDRTDAVYRVRPHSMIDTVVVPARDAWPFYVQHRAYVCQPGRWFQPVDRIAFYADQEIKADVPLVLHRRDNVPWTAHEETRLAASSDRFDRRVAAVIAASRSAGSSAGAHQIFLLTRPGDEAHRTLSRALRHETSGRGSAFVQRQRYVSLHALETANTTADLTRPTGDC